jgi:hypothetical protein
MKDPAAAEFTTRQVADMIGMTVSGARKWLLREGLAVKVAGRWRVSMSRLAAEFPEAFQRMARRGV